MRRLAVRALRAGIVSNCIRPRRFGQHAGAMDIEASSHLHTIVAVTRRLLPSLYSGCWTGADISPPHDTLPKFLQQLAGAGGFERNGVLLTRLL